MGINITNITAGNAAFITQEMAWLLQLIDTRLRTYFDGSPAAALPEDNMPDAASADGTYAAFIVQHQLNAADRVLLALSFAPLMNPALLDVFTIRNSAHDKKFAEFGGKLSAGDAFIPTIETALFLLSGNDLDLRFQYHQLFGPGQALISSGVIELGNTENGESPFSVALCVSAEYLEYFITGQPKAPIYGDSFPARAISTGLNWADYVASEATMQSINEIRDWIIYGDTVLQMDGLRSRLKPGYKALFHGPPGTGKTLAAALLGQGAGLDVYRIDLSQMVSRYIGETEKNLAKVFDRAENKRWILFFDEADALFGKRTEISSSNDRFANQEVAYLLQRIEDHNGLVILATNLKDNIDKAFLRRFQSVILFPMPNADERAQLWLRSFPPQLVPAKNIDWTKITHDHALSGAAITNVVRYCALKAVSRGDNTIILTDIEAGIKKELHKEGILF